MHLHIAADRHNHILLNTTASYQQYFREFKYEI